jgi:parallel beta-helix repeat protein
VNPKIKDMKVRTLFTLLTLALGIQANATNYYFSSSQGDDSRTSTQAQNSSTPWKSIDKLNSFASNLKAGDQILFKSGDTFYGAISTTKSGTTSAPITFSSYGSGAKPVISGLTTVSSWTSKGNGIYESNALTAGTTINMVVINGKQYAMGRYPNANSSNGGYLNFESHGTNYIKDNENPLTSAWIGAQLVVRTGHYTMQRSTISNISGTTISYSTAFRGSLTDKYGYFVQNSLKALDQFGEWYYNPTTKKIDVYFGSSSPNSNTVQVSTKEILLTLEGSNVIVNNIAIRGANKYGIWGNWGNVSNLQVKNCTIEFSGVDGIAIAQRHDFVMDSTTITNSNSVGVSFYTGNFNPVVKNSTIQNSGTFQGMLLGDDAGKYGMGIYSNAGVTVTNNKVINSGYDGIAFYGNNNLIQNNYVDTFCTLLDDGGGIYTQNYTSSGKTPAVNFNNKIVNNIVLHGIGAKAGTYSTTSNYVPAEGIYLDAYTNNIQVLNNTAAYCADAGIYVHNTRNYTVLDNIFYNNKSMQIGLQHDGTGYSILGGIIRRNQLFSQTSSQYVLSLASPDNDFNSTGLFDSNYYCRPSNEDKINLINWFSHKPSFYNLSGWQSAMNKDLKTKKTPVAVSDTSHILFQYNASTSSKTVTLNGFYVDLNGTRYSDSMQLAPYTSILLLKTTDTTSTTTSNLTASAAAVTNTTVKSPGYVNSEATLTVKAYPNPSSYYFNVTTQGGSTSEPMTLRVVDMSGKVVYVKTGITTNNTLQIGQNLAPGSYAMELIQGNKKVEQKVIKLSK